MNDILPPRDIVPLLLIIAAFAGALALLLSRMEINSGCRLRIARQMASRAAHLPPTFVTPWGIATLLVVVGVAGALGAYG